MRELRLVLCAFFGHPPVVRSCFGQLTCARCDAIVEDTLGEVAVIGCVDSDDSCAHCDETLDGMSWRDRLFTPTKRA